MMKRPSDYYFVSMVLLKTCKKVSRIADKSPWDTYVM